MSVLRPLGRLVPVATKIAIRKFLLRQLNAVDAEHETWTFDSDGLKTAHNTDFLREPAFAAAYKAASATGSWHGGDVRFRAYVACWAAQQVRSVPGDFVECGVNRGGLATAQMKMLDFAKMDKQYWLVDTYAGFPSEQSHLVSPAMRQELYGECYQDVLKTFAPYPNARVVRGTVPEILPEVKAARLCYLSLDMNCAEPEIAALEYFYDRLSPGAIVLMDDYAYAGYERQKEHLDAFVAAKNVSILALPTGQGLLVI